MDEQNQDDETFAGICARLQGTDLNANLKCLSIYNLIPLEISAASNGLTDRKGRDLKTHFLDRV